jgi:hypothetical protein
MTVLGGVSWCTLPCESSDECSTELGSPDFVCDAGRSICVVSCQGQDECRVVGLSHCNPMTGTCE